METVQLFDFDGRQIREFAQWDTNVSISVQGVKLLQEPVVHFYTARMTKAYRVAAKFQGEMLQCIVPSAVLRQAGAVQMTVGYARQAGAETVTAYYARIPVKPRPKPEDYVPDADSEWVQVTNEAKLLLEQMQQRLEEMVTALENANTAAEKAAAAAEKANQAAQRAEDAAAAEGSGGSAQIIDDTTGTVYRLGIDNGQIYLEEV